MEAIWRNEIDFFDVRTIVIYELSDLGGGYNSREAGSIYSRTKRIWLVFLCSWSMIACKEQYNNANCFVYA